IGEAGVDVAGIRALEARLGLLGGLIDMALGEEQRLGGLAELRADGAAVDEARRRPDAGGVKGLLHRLVLAAQSGALVPRKNKTRPGKSRGRVDPARPAF